MEMNIEVVDYQCVGCVYDRSVDCFEQGDIGIGCKDHHAGTMMVGIGKLLLGMPKGFNRIGPYLDFAMFESFEDGDGYDKFNIPTWKYLNSKGHTLVRGHRPRTNLTFVHVYLENCMDKVNCYEVILNDINSMD